MCRVTDAVNVNVVAVGEVVVDDKVDSFEVHATTHDVSAYENPHGARPKPTDHRITLHTRQSTGET